MSWKSGLLFCVIVGCGLASVSSFAANTAKDPLQRLVAQVPDSSSGADHVSMFKADNKKLPPYIAGQLAVAASCAGDNNDTSGIVVYGYYSDRSRIQKLLPDYIFDLSGYNGKSFKRCSMGELCRDGQCALIGYQADARGWKQSFFMMMTRWGVKTEPKSQTDQSPRTKIAITAKTEDSCKASDQTLNADGTCATNYVWHEKGLVRP